MMPQFTKLGLILCIQQNISLPDFVLEMISSHLKQCVLYFGHGCGMTTSCVCLNNNIDVDWG